MSKKLKINEEKSLLKDTEIEELDFQEEKKNSMHEKSVSFTPKSRQKLHEILMEKKEDLTKPWYFTHM